MLDNVRFYVKTNLVNILNSGIGVRTIGSGFATICIGI